MKILRIEVLSSILLCCSLLLINISCKSQNLNRDYIEFGSFINTTGLPFKAGKEAIKLNRPLGIRLSYGQQKKTTKKWSSNYEVSATFYRQRHLNYSYQIEGNYTYTSTG